jgi:hypothetical protein
VFPVLVDRDRLSAAERPGRHTRIGTFEKFGQWVSRARGTRSWVARPPPNTLLINQAARRICACGSDGLAGKSCSMRIHKCGRQSKI